VPREGGREARAGDTGLDAFDIACELGRGETLTSPQMPLFALRSSACS